MYKKYSSVILLVLFFVIVSMIGCVSAGNLTVNSSVGVQGALNSDSSFDVVQTENMDTNDGFSGLVDQGVQASMELDTVAPVAVSCDPGYNAVNVESNKTITIEFNENISRGTGLIELKNSNGVLVPITVSISGNVLIITPVNLLTEDKYTLTCHEGGVTDLAGNQVQEGTTYFTTGTSPIVTNVTPSVGETNVALNRNITITFNEPVKAGNSWFELYYTNNGTNIQVPVNISINGNILTISPLNQLTENRYTLVGYEGGVTDLAGNPMPAGMMEFITGSSPIVTNVTPYVGETNVALNQNITITFNEPVKAGSLWFELYCVNNGDYVLVPVNTSISGNIVTIIPSNLLAGCRHILVGYEGSVTDLAGNPVQSGMMEFATISDLIAPTVTANLASGVYNTTKIVTLTATDNSDPNPSIYYTTNGSTPTTSSTRYINPINITSSTILKFMAVDNAGNQAEIQTRNYTLTLPIMNIDTGKTYLTIQEAIDDPLTVDGDVIEIRNGTYTENVLIDKSLTIFSDGNVTVRALNPSLPVFTIHNGGSGSLIMGLVIMGSTGNSGIYINGSVNCTLYQNNITGNLNGVYLNNATGLYMAYNIINNNTANGLYINTGSGNYIYQNTLEYNSLNGIQINNSANNQILSNAVINNLQDGLYIFNSFTEVHFNQIAGNSRYGLYGVGNVTVNATNNWWGTNIPSNSADNGSAVNGGRVLFDPYLMLELTGSTVHVTKNSTSSSQITVDITHNNRGDDTSGSGTIPDGLPVNFTASLPSTIVSSSTTRRGKATVTLTSSSSSGATTVTASTYNQTVSKLFRKSFNTIQSAISNSLTVNGDVILVENGTYTENVVVNKNLTIISDGNVTVQASNPSNPVFTITSGGSGSWIQGFVISGAENSFGLYLVGCSNCTINSNTITINCVGVGTSTTKTENNVIMYNDITSNQVGLGTSNGHNYVIYQNTITYNSNYGIELFNSNNTVIDTNLIMENINPDNYTSGIYLSNSNNTLIQNNPILGNDFGLDIEQSVNCTVKSNVITDGIVGILAYYSSATISFNRIVANSDYGLYNMYGNINATNNWWGSNTNPLTSTINICNVNGTVNTTSWLMLSIDPSSPVNSGGNASIIADLTHNNLGQDTSVEGHVMNGIPINFTKTSGPGSLISPACTIKGQAVAILNLGTTTSQTVTVCASLDDQNVFQQMIIAPGVVILNITSSALNISTFQPISFTYTVPLDSSVTWLSVLWNNPYVFCGELEVIVNGVVVKSVEYVSPAYYNWIGSYRDDVFRAVIYANYRILHDGIDPNAIPVSFWNDLTSAFNLNSTELQFVQNHRLEFIDNLTVNLSYPGVVAPVMAVTDPETNSTINLNFTGDSIHRTSQITYMDGFFVEPAGYEGVKSFAIATTEVTASILTYWLNQNLTYPVGAMKAAYGSFLTALLVEYCHDQIADNLASAYNVTWSRTHPIAVSVGDDACQTYLTLECDHVMGMTVVGKPNNMKLFNYLCSSAISPIEYAIMTSLGFQFQSNSVLNGSVGSVMIDLVNAYLNNNTSVDVFIQNGFIIESTNNTNFIVIDPETGVVRDINIANGFCGAYCYSNLQTGLAYELCESQVQGTKYFNLYKATTVCLFILPVAVWGVSLVYSGGLTGILAAGMAASTDVAMWGAVYYAWDTLPYEPTWIDEPYDSQIMHGLHIA